MRSLCFFAVGLLLWPSNAAVHHDYAGRIAAYAAYAAMMPTKAPAKPKVPTKDCTTCKGTGRVRTGDDLNWTKCPDCDGVVDGKALDESTSDNKQEMKVGSSTSSFRPAPLSRSNMTK